MGFELDDENSGAGRDLRIGVQSAHLDVQDDADRSDRVEEATPVRERAMHRIKTAVQREAS
jgi:hypothetical protein